MALIAITLGCLAGAPEAHAASGTWQGASGADWNTPGSWISNNIPGVGQSTPFTTSTATNTNTATFTGGGTGTSISVADSSANRNFSVLTFTGTSTLANYTIGSSLNTLYFTPPVSNAYAITLTGATAFTGVEEIDSNLMMTSTSTTSTTSPKNDLGIQLSSNFSGTLTLAGNISTVAAAGSGVSNLLVATAAGNTVVLSGLISDGASGNAHVEVTHTTAGTLLISHANTFSGGFISGNTTSNSSNVTQIGVDSVGSAGNITSSAFGTGTLSLSGGTISSSSTAARTIYNNWQVVTGTTTNYFGNTTNHGTLTFAGTGALLSGNNTFSFQNDAVFSGVIGGATNASILLADGGSAPVTVTFSGLNTYNYQTVIGANVTLSTGTAGTIANSGVASSIGEAAYYGQQLTLDGGTLQDISSGGNMSTDRLFEITANGGTIDSSGTGTLTFSRGGSSAMMLAAGTGDRTLTLTGSNTGTNTMAPVIVDPTSGLTSVTKSGVGTWALTNANTFSGVVAIKQGNLIISSVATGATAQSLGKNITSSAVSLGVASTSSGTLTYTGAAGTLDKSITVLGNGGDTIQNSGTGVLTLSGSITKNGTTLTLNGGSKGIKVTGVISGSSSNSDLDITNGTTTLSTLATYNGPTWIYGSGVLVNGVTGGALPTGTTVNIGTAGSAGVSAGGAATAGTFDLGGFAQTIAGLNTVGTGSHASDIVTNNGSANATLTVSGGGSFAGLISNGSKTTALSVTGGSLNLSGANTYSGGTTVSSGTLVVSNGSGTASTTAANNTNGSATGTGTLSVSGGGTLAGTGTTAGSSFSISGSSTSNRATVLVGQTSGSDHNTNNTLTLLGGTAAGNSAIANANLVFNLNVGTPGNGNQLNVGSTGITFNSILGGTTMLTLNMQGVGTITQETTYLLIAGTGSTTLGAADGGGFDSTGQYAGLILGSGYTFGAGTAYKILNSGLNGTGNLTLAFGDAPSNAKYGPSSYLFLYVDSQGKDNIEVQVVPEPGTSALMLSGVAMLIFWQRRKKI